MSIDPRPGCPPIDQRQCVGAPAQAKRAITQPHQILLDSTDTVLTEVLGCKVREALYDRLARQYFLAKQEIPANLDKISELLKGTFGKGAATLERRIASKVYVALGLKFVDVPNFGLQEHVELIRRIVEQSEKINAKNRGGQESTLDGGRLFGFNFLELR